MTFSYFTKNPVNKANRKFWTREVHAWNTLRFHQKINVASEIIVIKMSHIVQQLLSNVTSPSFSYISLIFFNKRVPGYITQHQHYNNIENPWMKSGSQIEAGSSRSQMCRSLKTTADHLLPLIRRLRTVLWQLRVSSSHFSTLLSWWVLNSIKPAHHPCQPDGPLS